MKKISHLFFCGGLALCFHNAWAQKIISKADYYLTDESGKKISAVFSSLDDFNDSGIAISMDFDRFLWVLFMIFASNVSC